MTERELQYSDGKSHKFWRISLDDCTHTVQFGRIGTAGQTQTKQFASEAEAASACEKLVQEKLRKGYVEVGAASAEAPAAEPAPSPEEETAAPAAAPSPTVAEARPDAFAAVTASAGVDSSVPELTRRLHLDPMDWLRATWRPYQAPPRPTPPPFSLRVALEGLAQVPSREYRREGWLRSGVPGEERWWEWGWSVLAPLPLSREEARFWLLAMTLLENERASPAELSAALAQQSFEGEFGLDAVRDAIGSSLRHYRPEILIPVRFLLSPEDLVDLLVETNLIGFQSTGDHDRQTTFLGHALGGFETYVVPLLSASERERMCQRLSPLLHPSSWPGGFHYYPPPMPFHLAADLGCSAGLLPLVESWKDDYFRDAPSYTNFYLVRKIIFSLGDPALVETHMRRLRLRLEYPDDVRAWLAHTEYSALDYVVTSILAVDRKESAEALTKTLALAEAPETAPAMLQLMHESKAPWAARQWLEEHPDHAIAGLVPVAAGRGRLAEEAAEFLRALKRKGHGAALRARVRAQPPEVRERVQEVVLQGDTEQAPVFDAATTPERLRTAVAKLNGLKRAKKSTWVDLSYMPPILVGTHRLSDPQVEAVLLALQNSQATEAQELIGWLQEEMDRDSLDAFLWKLFELWQVEGAPSEGKWALMALGLLSGWTVESLRPQPEVPGE